MSYSEVLASRIRAELAGRPGVVEKKMFGGVAFMLQGNLACGVNGDNLIVRVGPEKYAHALAQPHTRPFDLSGRPMAGWVYVEPEGYTAGDDLKNWLRQGTEFADSLPPK